jgi:tetratricopeptide (TPR) repeat protein
MLFEAARYDAACEKAQRALDVDAGFWAALNLWGLSLDRLGRVDEALQKFEKTRELAPREPDGYISAIDLLRRVGRKQEADDLAAQLDNVTGVRPRGARSPGRR